MAAALISPSAPYQHHAPYNSGYPHSAPATSIPGMISPVEPRRPSDESEPARSHRQSLPSISEVISGTKPVSYPPPPPAQMSPAQGLPSPFSSSGPPRPFGDVGADKNPSPRALHPSSSAYPRPDSLPAFTDPARPTLASRPVPPPLNTFPGQHPSPPVKLEHPEAEQRHTETPQSLSAGHRPQQAQPLPGLYSETGRLPPGQLPLSAYPVSPRHIGPALPSPYEPQRPAGAYGEEGGHSHGHRLSDYKAAFDKHFETWGYQEALQQIASSCRTGYHFAEAYVAAAREQQGSQPIASRMPTENEVSLLLNNLVLALKKLEDVRDMIQQNRLHNERARENGNRKPEDEDVAMYGDGMKPAFGMGEAKKRRGRAAPPGRCHSCNRIDTPEWRRGPDGARTLCNACGLHYAKLERKRQLDQRSIRPKPAEERK
ncbi:GATA zinc finger domain-containing protein 10 [Madurella mycetomatis]|uniref:GATA zinc finger domain-containing protein 10 n=1 Tax=Madurella mycetomatis TaxID=100816 RepID=A0A175VR05_9PEZI|nr:GATA zinc finger domain-containing protein 10 [Madurella mycetomatis]